MLFNYSHGLQHSMLICSEVQTESYRVDQMLFGDIYIYLCCSSRTGLRDSLTPYVQVFSLGLRRDDCPTELGSCIFAFFFSRRDLYLPFGRPTIPIASLTTFTTCLWIFLWKPIPIHRFELGFSTSSNTRMKESSHCYVNRY